MEHHFVDVWHAGLVPDTESLTSMVAVLDEREKNKVDTFKLPLARNRYIAVRALLRQILAGYLQTDPAKLQFTVGEYGKPALACDTVHFNISHTGDHLLIAVADMPDIGIDIETLKPRAHLDGLARRCFTVREYNAWRQLTMAESVNTFYRLWSKKEAFVKAIGRGIGLGLDQCEVDWDMDGQLLAIPAEYGEANDWRVTEISVTSACAALVTPRREFKLRHRRFDVSGLASIAMHG